jgi:hypothetical protein
VAVCLHREGYNAVEMRLHSYIRSPLLLVLIECRRSRRGRCPGEGIHGEAVDDGNVGDRDALWQGHEDTISLHMYRHAVLRPGGTHHSAQRYPDRDFARAVHRAGLGTKTSPLHTMADVQTEEGGPTTARHCGGIQGHHGEAKPVAVASPDLRALQLQRV